MNNLQIFSNEEFGQVRTVDIDGKPYFVAVDIARPLGYANTTKAINDHCKGVTKRYILTAGGQQEVNVIPEGDIYRLAARSQLPSAEKFEKWIFDEVLPSIRQNGGYGLQAIPTDLQVLQGMLSKLIQQEAEIRLISEQSQKAISTSQAIKDTIVAEYDNWRDEIKRQINTIQKKSSMTYQDTYNALYDDLERRARCDLSARVRNGRDRLIDSGATKTKIEAFGRMDVIEADARLREIFTAIVKEYAVKYVA